MNKSILLVDDDELLLETFKIFLEMEGYNVIAAESPYKALQLIETHQIQLAILDYNLPNMNGVQLGRLIHKLQEDAKIMFISGNPDIHELVKEANYSVSAVLAKPIEADHFTKTVKNITSEQTSTKAEEIKEATNKIQKMARLFKTTYSEAGLNNLSNLGNVSI